MEMKVLKDRKKEILDTGGPMAERLRNQERFDASRDYAGLNALPAGSPANSRSAAGSSSSDEAEGEVCSQKPVRAFQPLSQSSSQCSIPARQPEPAPSSGSSTEEGGTSTSEADTGGKDFAGSSKGGCLRSEVHRVKSPLNLSLFSFGDDSPPEDMYSKKKKIVEMVNTRYVPFVCAESTAQSNPLSVGTPRPGQASQEKEAEGPQPAGVWHAPAGETPRMGRGLWKLNSALLEDAEVRQSFEDFLQSQIPLVGLCNSKSEWWEIFKVRVAKYFRELSSLRNLSRYRLYQGLRRKLEQLVSTEGNREEVSRVKSLLRSCQYDRHASLVFERDFGRFR
ncbi:uncharacterized protein [Eleutherodactylus coqui]|uniref:uncharacterized protein n=1 Tax=Eleutherodactylus coqui TaxID=57060 RepID=UPI003463804C